MKKTITALLTFAAFTLTGCQQLNDATGKVGESINSSLQGNKEAENRLNLRYQSHFSSMLGKVIEKEK